MNDLITQAAQDLVKANHAIALTGAGISTESGIQDYRGPAGVWTLNPAAEKRAYRSYTDFISDPGLWWRKALSPAEGSTFDLKGIQDATPNIGHYLLAELEELGILKCVITQNVDSLHKKAGSKNLIEYHGSVSKYRCLSCGNRYGMDAFDLDLLYAEQNLPPECPLCGGVIKTDGVFFGEPIPRDVMENSVAEANACDVMMVCGTSAVVYPFAGLPSIAKERKDTVVFEINAEPTLLTYNGISDYLIQGKIGEILPRIVEMITYLTG